MLTAEDEVVLALRFLFRDAMDGAAFNITPPVLPSSSTASKTPSRSTPGKWKAGSMIVTLGRLPKSEGPGVLVGSLLEAVVEVEV
jgi:hypothetical protein